MSLESRSLESLVSVGRELLNTPSDAGSAHSRFMQWDNETAEWLDAQFPGSGKSADWSATSSSPLATKHSIREDQNAWVGFRMSVQRRLKWLSVNCSDALTDAGSLSLQSVIDSARSVLREDDPHSAHRMFEEWADTVYNTLRRTYPNSSLSGEWQALPYSNLIRGGVWSKKQEDWNEFRSIISSRVDWLARLQAAEFAKQQSQSLVGHTPTPSREVFIVHGRDRTYLESVARFLEKLELSPVILHLHEQANKGRTIVEKFVDHANARFAIVLLTGDDIGGLKDGKMNPRARQNVVLELGSFLGALGRENVCALREDGVELPSDFDGVLYTELDAKGTWKLELAKEIKAAGIAVDLNAAI